VGHDYIPHPGPPLKSRPASGRRQLKKGPHQPDCGTGIHTHHAKVQYRLAGVVHGPGVDLRINGGFLQIEAKRTFTASTEHTMVGRFLWRGKQS
jgi:hypothetical protein